MGQEMKKRAVLELIREEYHRASRFYKGVPKHDLTVKVSLGRFPVSLKMALDELASILLEIEKEYRGKINVLPLNANNVRISRDYYPVKIKPNTFTKEPRHAKKPTVILHDGDWCVAIPGQKQLIRAGRKGSFNGELFAILAERWGTFQSVDYVLEELDRRVTDPRTKGTQMPEMIRVHLAEINETLSKGGKRRLHRIGDWPRTVGVIWANTLWSAVLRMSRGVLVVGFAKVRKPIRATKKSSK